MEGLLYFYPTMSLNFPIIISPELSFRPLNNHDAERLAVVANNPRIADNLMDAFPHPYTLDEARQFIARVSVIQPPQVLAIVFNGTYAGSIGIFPQQDINRLNAELGYWLAEEFWNKGIMTNAVKAMTEYAFEAFSIDRIFARPFPFNTASIRVLEKAGFRLEARIESALIKKGVVMDELIYAIRRQKK